MFNNTKMILSRSNSAVNIKTMFLMLLFTLVCFGVFSSNAFAMEESHNPLTNTHTYTFEDGDTFTEPPITLESGHNYVINVNGGDFTEAKSIFKSDVDIDSINVTANYNSGTVVDLFYNNNGTYTIKNSQITVNTLNFSKDINYENCTINVNINDANNPNESITGDFTNRDMKFVGNTFNFNVSNSTFDSILVYSHESWNYSGGFACNSNIFNVNVENNSKINHIAAMQIDPLQGGSSYNLKREVYDNEVNLTVSDDSILNGFRAIKLAGGGYCYPNQSQGIMGYGVAYKNTLNIYSCDESVFSNIGYRVEEGDALIEGGSGARWRYDALQYEQVDAFFISTNPWGNKVNDLRTFPNSDTTLKTAEATPDSEGGIDVKVPVTKLLNMTNANAQVTQDFNFSMSAVDSAPAPTDNSIVFKKEGFNSIKELISGKSQKAVISNRRANRGNEHDTFDIQFTKDQVGEYKYTVAETAPETAQLGLTQDTNSYELTFTTALDGTGNQLECTNVKVEKKDKDNQTVSTQNYTFDNFENITFENGYETVDLSIRNADKTGSDINAPHCYLTEDKQTLCIPKEKDYAGTLTADQYFKLPETIKVRVNNILLDNSKYTYNNETGAITIQGEAITGKTEIEAKAIQNAVKVKLSDELQKEINPPFYVRYDDKTGQSIYSYEKYVGYGETFSESISISSEDGSTKGIDKTSLVIKADGVELQGSTSYDNGDYYYSMEGASYIYISNLRAEEGVKEIEISFKTVELVNFTGSGSGVQISGFYNIPKGKELSFKVSQGYGYSNYKGRDMSVGGTYYEGEVYQTYNELPKDITITVGGRKLSTSEYTYNSTTGDATIHEGVITGDVVVTAEGQPKQSIIFDANSGSFTTGDEVRTVSVYNGTLNIITTDGNKRLNSSQIEQPTFGSNEFLGWYTDPVGGEKIDFANWDASVIPEDIDVYHLNFNQNMQIYELDKISDTDSTYHFKVYAHWTRGTGNTGESINAKLKQITGQDGAIVQTENTTIKSFERSNEMPADEYLTDNYKISGNDSNFPIYAWFDSETGTMYYYTADERPMLNADSSDMFANMTGLEKVDLSGFDGYLDKTDSMFENCSSLKTIYATDKIRFNQNATSENMFTGCNALIGGNGTKVTSTDNTNAKLDRPDAQGYFSLKFINFDAGEGAFADGSKFTRRSVVDQDNLVGTAFDESKVEKPTKPGYVLKEWNTKADGTGESLNDINLSTQSVSKDLFSLLAQAWDSSSVPSGNTSYEYDVFAIYKLTPADAELTSDSTYMTAESGFGSGKVDINQVWTGKIKTIAEGYTMPDSITVKVGNTTLSDGYTYNKSTGEITVDAEHTTGKISITAVAVAPKYDVSLTNDSSNITGGTGFGANGATFNAEWNGSIYGSNGHGVPETIIVTVNGNELAASDYSYDNKTGAIKIPGNKITGPITIKAVGVETTASNMFSTGSQAKDAQGGIDVYIPVTKVMEMNDKDATILNDYTFTMTPGTVAHTQDAYQGTTSPAPTDNSVIVKADGFNNIHELTDGKKTVASNTDSNTGNTTDTFVVHFNKDQIGQFHYTVVENPIDGLQSGITMDTNKYDVVVTINYENAADINSGNVRCEGVTVTKLDANGNAIGKTAENESSVSDRGGAGADIQNVVFTNRFHTANVLVDKTVNGSLGDKTRDFTFTFNVTGTGIPTTYKLYKTNAANETAEAVDVQNGSTFTLKHGESAKVMGLPEGAHYSIVETGVADYTTNINASLGDEQYNQYHTLNYHNGSPYAFGTNGDALPNAPASTGSEGENIAVSPYSDEWMSSGVAITANSNLDEHHFTNTKGQLIPTGLIENVTSFLGLALVVALAIAYVLYSRRKGTTKA